MSGEVTTVRREQPLRAPTARVSAAAGNTRAAARARRRRSRESSLVAGLQVAVLLLLLAGMYLLNAAAGNLTMPSPFAVAEESWVMWTDGTMLEALGESVAVIGLGFLLSATTGVIGGVFLGGFRIVGRILDPFVNAMNSTPGIAFIPLIIVWFGLYTEAKVVVVWNAAFFPILISAAAGVDHADNDLIEMGRSFGFSRARLFWQIMLPSALPSILSGLRIGASVATVGTVVAELTMAQSGLGGLLAASGNRFQMDRYFAVIIVLMVLGTIITTLLRWAERRAWGWQAAQRATR